MSDPDYQAVHPDDDEILAALASKPVHVVGDEVVLENGWRVEIFYDAGVYDYVDYVHAPDGRMWTHGPTLSKDEAEAGFLPFGDSVFDLVLPIFVRPIKVP